MTLLVEIPDSLAADLGGQPSVAAKAVLEGFAVEAYRDGRLSAFQVRQLLGHGSRWATEDFLSSHDAWPGATAEEVAADGRKLNALLSR